LLQADDDLTYNITKATFKANSTLDWHKHGTVQVLIVIAGTGYYQEKGKEPVLMEAGDIIKCEKKHGTLAFVIKTERCDLSCIVW
jgi:quercetin dioxygenase-like cupin family protein